jgi:hypothetical protein
MKLPSIGLLLVAAMVATTVFAYTQNPWVPEASGRRAAPEVQVAQLDARLVERIQQQTELLDLVDRLLKADARSRLDLQGTEAPLLGSLPSPRSTAPVPAPVQEPAKPAAESPWWNRYQPQMVYVTPTERYAVINGQMRNVGQSLGDFVIVDAIESDAVVLRRGTEHFTYLLPR